jgi:hypothetical protein
MVINQKVQGRNHSYILKTFLKIQLLGTSKYTILLILLKFQNLWNLINVFIKKIMKIFIEVFLMIFQNLMGPEKSKCGILNGTTQG